MFLRILQRLHRCEAGANLAEYAIIGMAVAVAAVVFLGTIGDASAANVEAVLPGFGG